jgi:hypothetical protein
VLLDALEIESPKALSIVKLLAMGAAVVVAVDADAAEEEMVAVEAAVVVLKLAVNAIGIALSCGMAGKPFAG